MGNGYATILAVEPPPAANRPAKPFLSVEFWLAVGLLIGVLLAGAVALSFMDRWRKRQLLARQDSAEALTSFRELYEQGELSDEEYQRVRNRVAAKMKDSPPQTPIVTDTPIETPIVQKDDEETANEE